MADDAKIQEDDEKEKPNVKLGCGILVGLLVFVLLALGMCVALSGDTEPETPETPQSRYDDAFESFTRFERLYGVGTATGQVRMCPAAGVMLNALVDGADAGVRFNLSELSAMVTACQSLPRFSDWRNMGVGDKQATANRLGIPCGRDCK